MITLDDVVFKISADIKGAMAGIAKVETAVSRMDNNVGKSTASIRKSTAAMGKAFATLGVGAVVGLGAVVGKATMDFGKFEQAVTNAASVTGQSGAQYEATKKNISELSQVLGEETVFSAAESANAMYDLASAGYDVGTMVKADLQPILDLAAATQADLTFATETVTSTLGQFGMGIEDSSRISDVFAKTIGSSKATIDKLGASLKYVGPIANSLGMDIEDVSAMLGQLYNAGFKGEQAGTALRGAMARLMNPTAEIDRVLTELGITYDQVNPATNDFADTLELLKNSGIDSNEAMKLFGVEAAPAMLSLLENVGGINELETSLRGAAGAASDMATKQLDTLKGAFTELKSAISGVMLMIGEMAAPAIKDFAVKAKEAIPALKVLITEGFVKLKQIIKDLSPTFTNLKTIFKASIGIVKDIFASFKSGNTDVASLVDVINTLTGSLAKAFVWIDKHPQVTKLAVTIGAAAVAFAYIVPIVTAVVSAMATVGAAVSGAAAFFAAGGTIASGLGIAIAAIGGPITLIIAAVALLAAAWATNLFGIRDKTASVMATIKYWIDSTKTVITNNIELIKTALTLLLGPIGLVIIAFKNWDKIKEIVGKMATAISDKMTGLATSAKDWGKNMITAFIDGIKSNFTGVTSAVKEAAGIVGDYLGFSSPTKEGPGKDVMKWGPNMVQAFAEGVSNNIGAINGAFGSLATPAFGARALSQMAGVPAPSQTTQINISFRDPVIRDEADIDKIVSKIEKKLVNNIRGVNII